MHVLVEPGSFNLLNMGDVAMLQVTIGRLHALWPSASLNVPTDDPAALRLHCPHAAPLPAQGRRMWFEDGYLLGRVNRVLPRPGRRLACRLNSGLRSQFPGVLRALVAARVSLRPELRRQFNSYWKGLQAADLLLVAPQGGLTEHDLVQARSVLSLLEWALARGIPAAMLGQGIGPLRDQSVLTTAARVLPKVGLISIRERRASAPRLSGLGVPPAHVLTVGDCAIELAFETRQSALGDALGVNLRCSPSAGTSPAKLQQIAHIVSTFAQRRAVRLLPIPISRDQKYGDVRTIRELVSGLALQDGGEGLDTPIKVIRQVGQCRLIVTGAYHAAVFALAQGIPAICLAWSEYFRDKFLGLADLFGSGCQVVEMDQPDGLEATGAALESAWVWAPGVRDHLLAAAAGQLSWSGAEYARLAKLIDSRRALSEGSSGGSGELAAVSRV